MLSRLEEIPLYDIIIIGGGATGLGAAVDAASRGYKTLLLEQYDFGKGTSSKSTKLVHGGVRYLAQGNIKLVREALRERGWLLKNAPQLTHVQPFIVPVFSWWSKFYYSTGLKIYDILSGKLSLGKTKLLNKKQTLQLLPAINPKKLVGGILYYDGQFNDAELCTALAVTAAANKAIILNYAKVTGFTKEKEIITGVQFTDTISHSNYCVKTKSVINATGVFTDAILQMDEADSDTLVTPSQGIHLVVNKNFFPGSNAMMIPKTDDGRVLFAVPWQDKVVLGTTDTPVNIIDIEPLPLEEEINFILQHINRYTISTIERTDVKSVYAGLRPLVRARDSKTTALLSRDHTLVVAPSGLVTITGGKWTTYRKMAEDAVNNSIFVSKQERLGNCITQNLPLGNFVEKEKIIKNLIAENPYLSALLHPDYAYTRAALLYAIRYEMAVTIEDFLARRIRLLLLDAKAAISISKVVADMMAEELQKEDEWVAEQIISFNTLAQQYLLA